MNTARISNVKKRNASCEIDNKQRKMITFKLFEEMRMI